MADLKKKKSMKSKFVARECDGNSSDSGDEIIEPEKEGEFDDFFDFEGKEDEEEEEDENGSGSGSDDESDDDDDDEEESEDKDKSGSEAEEGEDDPDQEIEYDSEELKVLEKEKKWKAKNGYRDNGSDNDDDNDINQKKVKKEKEREREREKEIAKKRKVLDDDDDDGSNVKDSKSKIKSDPTLEKIKELEREYKNLTKKVFGASGKCECRAKSKLAACKCEFNYDNIFNAALSEALTGSEIFARIVKKEHVKFGTMTNDQTNEIQHTTGSAGRHLELLTSSINKLKKLLKTKTPEDTQPSDFVDIIDIGRSLTINFCLVDEQFVAETKMQPELLKCAITRTPLDVKGNNAFCLKYQQANAKSGNTETNHVLVCSDVLRLVASVNFIYRHQDYIIALMSFYFMKTHETKKAEDGTVQVKGYDKMNATEHWRSYYEIKNSKHDFQRAFFDILKVAHRNLDHVLIESH